MSPPPSDFFVSADDDSELIAKEVKNQGHQRTNHCCVISLTHKVTKE
jgi:hypothetical protein